MATHHESGLSRAVSSVDLNAALLASQHESQKGRYTTGSLLSLRLKSRDGQEGEEHIETIHSGVDADGVLTPQYPKPPPSTPADIHGSSEIEGDVAEDELNEAGLQVISTATEAPQKKKKRSSGKNRKAKPTGFEEFYADPPVTPAEFREETELYNDGIVFYRRIETCIQRYRARRNLDSIRSNILTKYLMLGGVESTAKAFTGGLDKETIDNSTADEIRAISATDYVRSGNKKYFDPNESEHWVVDFEGVARGFFSSRIPQSFATGRQADIKLYCSVIRNFLNYVLAHNVCTEYSLDVMAAREICHKAETELWAINQFRWAFPGDFNMAASTLYGGRYKGIHATTHTWENDDPDNAEWVDMSPGMSKARAERIFKCAIAFEGDNAMFTKVGGGDVCIIKTEKGYFELVRVIRATDQSIQHYAVVKDTEGIPGNIKALGVMVVRSWEGPGLVEEDYSDDESDDVTNSSDLLPEETTFWVEDEILKHLFPGLKMELRVHELNIGVKFFDTLGGPYCSFYKLMENEKMVNWKDPVPNTRPAPSEDNPEAEDAAFEAEMDGDVKDDETVMLSNPEVWKSIKDAEKLAEAKESSIVS